jgi:hypothetical protein
MNNSEMTLKERPKKPGELGVHSAQIQLTFSQACNLVDMLATRIELQYGQMVNKYITKDTRQRLSRPQEIQLLREKHRRFNERCAMYDALVLAFNMPDVGNLHNADAGKAGTRILSH